jgi:hypothetical protein
VSAVNPLTTVNPINWIFVGVLKKKLPAEAIYTTLFAQNYNLYVFLNYFVFLKELEGLRL